MKPWCLVIYLAHKFLSTDCVRMHGQNKGIMALLLIIDGLHDSSHWSILGFIGMYCSYIYQ